jgi:mRNA-degrading endonuclease YafQ of YafQ-DinJ toxin-antitoxin module|tara:strand:- start:22 stop:294 length:273 start_codon:yes stop_codon:yes gene_type:complete
MKVLQSGRFARRVKKLNKNEKASLDKAVREVIKDPSINKAKKGDLLGVSVHKYKYSTNLLLLAYSYDDVCNELTLLALGSHEDFYRDLKQ